MNLTLIRFQVIDQAAGLIGRFDCLDVIAMSLLDPRADFAHRFAVGKGLPRLPVKCPCLLKLLGGVRVQIGLIDETAERVNLGKQKASHLILRLGSRG